MINVDYQIEKNDDDKEKKLSNIKRNEGGYNFPKYIDYKNDHYWFHGHIDYPVEYFKNSQKSFLDFMYYYHIGIEYGEAFPEWLDSWYAFGEWNNWGVTYNALDQLGLEYNEDNIALDFLNGQHWLRDFPQDINNQAYYYNFNCKPCKEGKKCDCTWDPENDYEADYGEEDKWTEDFKKYINFMYDLHTRKVIYVSDNVKSPFRDYKSGWELCKVTVKLTQRDGPSDLSFWWFVGYPKVDWKRTHAWIDLAAKDSCNWDEVPVYSISDGVVMKKSHSFTSWWNSIIIKTIISGNEYFIRYSHLKNMPELDVWNYVNNNTLIGIQWDTWPSTAEHLDVTIYKWKIEYKSYLRDTLMWWGLFNFTFSDMLQNGFSDYTVSSFITNQCYNCDQ